MTLADHLARQRNRDAAERTLMAWIRTCLSLISFGFGLDKIVAAIRSRGGVRMHAEWSVRGIAIAFIITGVVAMVAATRQHDRNLRRLLREDFTYTQEPSIAAATAVMISLIGAAALLLLLLGALQR
ncbi:MAG: YidH family protein [Prochlorococcaceae cyanobacterium]|jgi:putative membrane protein